jgi:hypothetical protein
LLAGLPDGDAYSLGDSVEAASADELGFSDAAADEASAELFPVLPSDAGEGVAAEEDGDAADTSVATGETLAASISG